MALLDYLTQRREEIEAQIKGLRSELAEIRIAETALRGEPEAKRATVTNGAVIKAGTIKDWILKALMAYPAEGLETDGVIEAIRKMGGPLVERSSITPQLSRLKAARVLGHDGRHWRLPTDEEKAATKLYEELVGPLSQNDEASDGYQPSDASENVPRGPFT